MFSGFNVFLLQYPKRSKGCWQKRREQKKILLLLRPDMQHASRPWYNFHSPSLDLPIRQHTRRATERRRQSCCKSCCGHVTVQIIYFWFHTILPPIWLKCLRDHYRTLEFCEKRGKMCPFFSFLPYIFIEHYKEEISPVYSKTCDFLL